MRTSDLGAPRGPLFGLLLGVLVVLLMTVSPLALNALGLNYDGTGGSPLEKIHPVTMLAAALVLAAGAASGNPVTWALATATANPSLLPYLGVIALLIVHSLRVVELPFTHFFDTFVLPALLFVLLRRPDEARGRHLAWLLHALMAANAALGIFEFVTGFRLTPLVAGGVLLEDDWRSTALLGHPLSNACLTGSYLLALTLGGGRDLPGALRGGVFLLNAGGMVAFGGRASSVLLLLILAAILAFRIFGIARGDRFSTGAVLKGLLVAPIAGVVVVALAETGFFDQFVERFVDDKGSAETRVEMFELFRHIPLGELLLAPDARQVTTLQHMHGLEFGIESFWVSYVLSYGLIPSLVFFVALGFFSYDVIRNLRRGAVWLFVFFYAVASTSLSLSAKSPLLAVFTLIALVLMRPLADEQPGAARPRHRSPGGRPARAALARY